MKNLRQLLEQMLKLLEMQVWLRDQEVQVQVDQADQVDADHHQDIHRIEDHHQVIQTIEDLHQGKVDHQYKEDHQGDREVHHQAIHRIEVHLQAILRTEVLHQVNQVVQLQEVLHKITFSVTQIHSEVQRSDDFIIIESF
jgi:hypothetical protein